MVIDLYLKACCIVPTPGITLFNFLSGIIVVVINERAQFIIRNKRATSIGIGIKTKGCFNFQISNRLNLSIDVTKNLLVHRMGLTLVHQSVWICFSRYPGCPYLTLVNSSSIFGSGTG